MDTIAAISTGNTVSAIGVLRLSGPEAFSAADAVFRPADGRALSAHPRRTMVYGRLLDREGRTLDYALGVCFAAGASYTGEDSVEFHCHGSPVVLSEGLSALFAAGARQAERGEFTKRAFLNGKLDLTGAEAVIDLIEAETAQAARNAVEQLGGSLRRRIESVYDGLLEVSSRFYAVVDYPDEDVEDLERGALEAVLARSEGELRSLLSTFRRGQILRAGLPTAILGRPNAGKSSLLNALVGYDRAIVTDVAGTTRDTVEEKAEVGGVLLRLIDTAGLRETEDTVERLGVERAVAAARSAGLVLAVVDGSREMTGEDLAVLERAGGMGVPWILVRSKADLPGAGSVPCLRFTGGTAAPAALVEVSSVTGQGLSDLAAAVADLFPAGEVPAGQILTNARQAQAVERAADALARARAALDLSPDAALTDVEEAQNALGELTGRTAREDMVSRIFERFCVGK